MISIIKTIKYALKGIIYAIKNERNMRIHTVVAFYVLAFSVFFKMSGIEYIVLILVISLVMMAEMFNSAIESLIDLYSKDYNATAKAAKDIAAGGVLILAVAALIIGAVLFGKLDPYISMWVFFCKNPLVFILFLISILFSYLYVFFGPVEIKNKLKTLIRNLKSNTSNINNLGGKSNGRKN